MRYSEQVIQKMAIPLDITVSSRELLMLLKKVKKSIIEQQEDVFIQIEETINSIANHEVEPPIDTLIKIWDDLRDDQFETDDPFQGIIFDFQRNIMKFLIEMSKKEI